MVKTALRSTELAPRERQRRSREGSISRRPSVVLDLLVRFAFVVCSRTLSFLSLEGQRRAGRLLARLVWLLNTREVQSTLSNLQRCFPNMDPGAREKLARASLEQTGQLLGEVGATAHWGEHRWRSLIQHVEGEDLLGDAQHPDQPVLVLVPHFGNWEMLNLYLGSRDVSFLYDPPRQRALELPILAARTRTGARMLPIGMGGLRQFQRAFRARRLVALLPDQVPERRAGVYAPFFGVPALTMTFAHRLITGSNARVLLGTAIRCPGGFRVRFTRMPDDIADPDPVVSAAAMNRAVEALVMSDPAQYQWEYRRFKRPPPGQPDPYPRR
jgi:Kdo2-lipid IVA lauroyltransferase/acyltransferase